MVSCGLDAGFRTHVSELLEGEMPVTSVLAGGKKKKWPAIGSRGRTRRQAGGWDIPPDAKKAAPKSRRDNTLITSRRYALKKYATAVTSYEDKSTT
jgi:hypothetical protein